MDKLRFALHGARGSTLGTSAAVAMCSVVTSLIGSSGLGRTQSRDTRDAIARPPSATGKASEASFSLAPPAAPSLDAPLDQSIHFKVIGDLSDEAIDALASLLVEIANADLPKHEA